MESMNLHVASLCHVYMLKCLLGLFSSGHTERVSAALVSKWCFLIDTDNVTYSQNSRISQACRCQQLSPTNFGAPLTSDKPPLRPSPS